MKINLNLRYFWKYIISGIFVTSYSLIILSIFGEKNFLLTLTFVEISSHLIRWFFFEKFVYSEFRIKKKRQSFLKYIKAIILPYLLNIIFYIFFPLKTIFFNALRVVLISAIVGYFWSQYIYIHNSKVKKLKKGLYSKKEK